MASHGRLMLFFETDLLRCSSLAEALLSSLAAKSQIARAKRLQDTCVRNQYVRIFDP
jgi:hypothetical protein